MQKTLKLITFLLAILTVHPVLTQEITCLAVVQAAMAVTESTCDTTGRNQVCYGHMMLQAQPQPDIESFNFDFPGSRVDVSHVQSLQLSPLETDENVWGIAWMRLQANLPTSQLEDVTLLVFGDVTLENAVERPTAAEINVTADTFVNVRKAPTTSAQIVGILAPGHTVTALERLADQSWMRVELENGETGWVLGSLLSQPETPAQLNVVDGRTPYYRPMQAFYFQSGKNDNTDCPQQPTNGMLIQTPEGVGEITLLINEINVQIGSTVFFQAQPAGEMTITTLEGHASITADGVTHTAYAGSQLTVALTSDLKPAGKPSLPVPYDEQFVQSLPLNILDRSVEPVPALTLEEIEDLIEQETPQIFTEPTPNELVCPENNCVPVPEETPQQNGQPECPGNSCNAPGQGENGQPECPGNSCNAPGQSDNPPPGQGGTPPGQMGGQQTNTPQFPITTPPFPTNPPSQSTPPLQISNPPPQLPPPTATYVSG